MRTRYVLLAVGVAVLVLLPAYGGNYLVRFGTFLCMYAALALGWNVIGGVTGYPSFATAAFFGAGAYAGALLQVAHTPMPLAWAGAVVFVAAASAVVGIMILRLRGHYFAVGSIALVEVARLVASSWSDLTGGGMGLNVPILPGGPEYAGMVFLYSMFAVAAAAFAAGLWIEHGKLGFALRCIQQNEDAADMVGVNTTACKIAAFVLSAVFAGATGAVYASWTAYLDPSDAFSILLTLKVPVMAMLGGAGTVLGPIVGVVVFQAMEELLWSNFLEMHHAILGLMIVGLIFFLPGGLLSLGAHRRRAPARATSREVPAE
ncbi:branched-chain amino acid ABC transporter permease [Azospirillum canadense]|uniref:branched-chain amino acid ABC transporter permease n=1 Tax=Azospirillum canadense TaxID=403962 RepID=UPI002227F767|nr:branched-chain amino acid ABC transporter permease [Azospirillum canadense]MCW2239407.1 branched-chain amino acid transport system permease protein [Azospirillum canadense]